MSNQNASHPSRLRFEFLGFALAAAFVAAAPVAVAQPRHHPVNFSFFHPLSTNRHPDVSTNFRLGLFYGRVASVRGVDLSAVVARTDQDFRGLQVAGVHAYTGGSFRGIAFTGAANVVGGEGRGIQMTGGVNFDRDLYRGLQFAGIFNYVGGNFSGLQLSGVANLSDGSTRGIQLAPIANTAGGAFVGLQLSGINLANESVRGVQAGYCNFTPVVEGAQVGLVNFAGHVHGTQIGFWNQARRIDGVPVGAVNLAAENGTKTWVAYGSNYAAVNAGLRSGANGWYSMLTLGFGDLQDEGGDTAFLTWNYGHLFDVHAPWRLAADLGFVHAMPQSSNDPAVNDRLHFAVQARLLAERPLGSRWRLFFGGGTTTIWPEYSSQATPSTEPLAVLGFGFE